jgi:hypothetical protein
MNDNLIHENNHAFHEKYVDGDKRKKKPPLSLKLNDEDELMLEIASYMFNRDSKGGNLKMLARDGLKVLLAHKTADEWNYLTKGERRRTIQKRPNVEAFLSKGNAKIN